MNRQTYSYPEYNKKWRQDHLEYSREYYQAHPEQMRKYSRKYYQTHPEQKRKYRQAHLELYAGCQRKYRQAHSEQTREWIREWRKTHPEILAIYRARRRIREEKAIIEEVNPRYIYKRDNWICQICGKKVNPKLKYPNPMSASLDHIVPISKGGTHERKNLQLAHLICNKKKHNGGHDQLRLIG